MNSSKAEFYTQIEYGLASPIYMHCQGRFRTPKSPFKSTFLVNNEALKIVLEKVLKSARKSANIQVPKKVLKRGNQQ